MITGYANVEANTLITFRIAGGDMDDIFEDFWIICVDPSQPEQILGDTNKGYLKGQFEILAHGKGERKASLLQIWWFEWAPINGGQTSQMAKWLAQQLSQKRDVPSSYPDAFVKVNKPAMFNPIEAWIFAPFR